MNEEYDVGESTSLKSCKPPLQKNKNWNKNQEKKQFSFTEKNEDIDSYSYGVQSNTLKEMIRSIFWIF